jgi:hypothetical protein
MRLALLLDLIRWLAEFIGFEYLVNIVDFFIFMLCIGLIFLVIRPIMAMY